MTWWQAGLIIWGLFILLLILGRRRHTCTWYVLEESQLDQPTAKNAYETGCGLFVTVPKYVMRDSGFCYLCGGILEEERDGDATQEQV